MKEMTDVQFAQLVPEARLAVLIELLQPTLGEHRVVCKDGRTVFAQFLSSGEMLSDVAIAVERKDHPNDRGGLCSLISIPAERFRHEGDRNVLMGYLTDLIAGAVNRLEQELALREGNR